MTTPATTPTRIHTIAKRVAIVLLVVGVLIAIVYHGRSRSKATIGVEGRRIVEIAGPRLSAAPFTPGDALAVRIAEAQPTADGFRYDLRYMAFGPGRHDLSQSLQRPDGTSAEQSSALTISVDALLPENYSGELYDTPTSRIDLHSSYSLWMGLAWTAWAALLVPLAWFGHKQRRRIVLPPPPPTVAERLRSALEHATREDLTVEQQVDLEQLLLAFWSNRLHLKEERLAEIVAQLRDHPQAGPQWEIVERWFHSPNTSKSRTIAHQLLTELKSLPPEHRPANSAIL